MGRPAKPKGEKLSAKVLATMLPEEQKAAMKRAKDEGMSLSAWIRKLILDALAKK